ncbi:NERD domain-containing protein [Niallia sp. XMNu-256]|uniref:NERD domain-containing protein n=1 Tax=Niallia sp. XMNu-256 TaxID=3082444 RepID=UPI0030CA8271
MIFLVFSLLFLLIMTILTIWVGANFASLKGAYGEKQVSKLLRSLDLNHNTLLNDLYIPKQDGTTTQIDHVLISDKGLFVIETKNYNGWIFGSQNSKYWTQVIYKRKEKFYNPIWQNSGHIKELRHFLGDAFSDIPIYSLIVFGKQATLKFNKPFYGVNVIKIRDLLSVIKYISSDHTISSSTRKKIHQLLSSTYIMDKKEKKAQKIEHVTIIKQNINKQNHKVISNICPQCGGQLVSRKGKYGNFRGCNNYPNCRFTA